VLSAGVLTAGREWHSDGVACILDWLAFVMYRIDKRQKIKQHSCTEHKQRIISQDWRSCEW